MDWTSNTRETDSRIKLFLGCDPGLTGAMVLVEKNGCLWDCIRGSCPLQDRVDWLEAYKKHILFGVIENVHSMPGDGHVGAFKFGTSFGEIRGMVVANKIKREYTAPQTWQRYMKCLTGGDKNVSKSAAQNLFPDTKIIHAIADACLIAEYARRIAIDRRYFRSGRRTK